MTPPAADPTLAPALLLTGSADRDAVLARLAGGAAPHCGAAPQRVFEALRAREEKMPTAMPGGVAFPHALLAEAGRPVIVPAVLRPAVSFGAGPDRLVDVVFAIVGPAGGSGHLQALARLARLCRDRAVMDRVRAAATAAEVEETVRAGLD